MNVTGQRPQVQKPETLCADDTVCVKTRLVETTVSFMPQGAAQVGITYCMLYSFTVGGGGGVN